MDILTGEKVNGQLADELRAAYTQIARLEEIIRFQSQQIERLYADRAAIRRSLDTMNDSHARLQQDFLAAGRLLDARAYVNEIHELALTEQAKSNEVRRPH